MDNSNQSWFPSPSSSVSTDESSKSLPSSSNPTKKKEQKRRPKPRDGTVLTCGVCNDRALGYNFDAITCESCKAFFRRNAFKNKNFTCSFDGNCKLDAHTRKFCSGCRLKKCFSIGMKKDWILSESQLAKRRQRIREQQNRQRLQSVADSPSSCEITTNYTSDDVSSPAESPYNLVCIKPDADDEDEYPKPLPDDILAIIQNIEKNYTSIFDAPYTKDVSQKLDQHPRTSTEVFNMTDAFIRRLIKFGKILPEFRELTQEDQIHMLKGGIMEIFVLRSVMAFDKKTEKWKYSDTDGRKQLDPKIIAGAIGPTMYSAHMHFVKSLQELTNGDRYVLLLLFIIELFSPDRSNLKNKDLVAKSQEKYSNWLKLYMESIQPVKTARILYPKVLMKLTDVRDIGEESAKIASNLDLSRLQPLQKEIFDLDAPSTSGQTS